MSQTETAELEILRGPLTAYCYRMLGAAGETDDAVQDTLIRAWRSLDRFDPKRGQLSTWVHRIAHNVCVDMLRGARRRALAADMGPAATLGEGLGNALSADHFVEPMPDSRILTTTDPAELVSQRHTVRLAFIAALQYLTPPQRSALLLRDVLHFSAVETSEIMGCSVAAANSALQRARSRMNALDLSATDTNDPTDPADHALLDRYVNAFHAHDVAGLLAVLHDDATTSMPPFSWWLRGGDTIAHLMGHSDGCVGARLLATRINGAAGFGQYRPNDEGGHSPFALVRVEIRDGLISELVTFLGTEARFAEFGLPDRLFDSGSHVTDELALRGSYKG